MKIRNGFVSNSSSSSFVMLGAKLTTDELAKFNDEDGDPFEALYGLGLHKVNESDNIIGKRIVEFDESGFDDTEYKITDLNVIAMEVANKLGITIDRISLFTGMEMC